MTQTQQEKILQATVKFWTDGNYIYQSDVKFWNNKVKRYLALLAGMGVVVLQHPEDPDCIAWMPLLDGERREVR